LVSQNYSNDNKSCKKNANNIIIVILNKVTKELSYSEVTKIISDRPNVDTNKISHMEKLHANGRHNN